jgi:hypothetical protein
MNLIKAKSGAKLKGVIEKVSSQDLILLKTNKRFEFNWDLEKNNEVYKITWIEKKEIIGLISITDYPNEFRLHINLIESSKKYRGKQKIIKNIPGCLIGFVCKLSFKLGYAGFVSLIPKTQLVAYYKKKYGFLEFGYQMAVFENLSASIIQKYLGDEEI